MVSVDGNLTAVRRDRHPLHTGIAGAEMGVRAGDRLYRRDRRFLLRAWLPRTAPGTARTLCRDALAANPRIGDALGSRRWIGPPRGCCAGKPPRPRRAGRGNRRV